MHFVPVRFLNVIVHCLSDKVIQIIFKCVWKKFSEGNPIGIIDLYFDIWSKRFKTKAKNMSLPYIYSYHRLSWGDELHSPSLLSKLFDIDVNAWYVTPFI